MKKQPSFAENLKRERDKRGWSQEEAADKIGCATKTIVRWEGSQSFPRIYHRKKIAEIFALSLEEFNLTMELVEDDAVASLTPQTVVSLPELLDLADHSVTHSRVLETVSTHSASYRGIQGFPPPTHPKSIQQREQVVQAIYAKIMQPDITAIILTGIGGVGKSTIAALVYRYVLEHYQAHAELFTAEPIWLTISERVTMVDVVSTLFDVLGKPLPNPSDLTPYNQVMMLFHALNTEAHARLIILDQFENVLDWQTGDALIERPGVGEWLDVINSQPCFCKMLLTSRVWPRGTREYPPTYMQEYIVDGLDQTEGAALLRKQGIGTKQASDAHLRNAVTRCAGHALALTLLAALLRQNPGLSLPQLFSNALYTKLWQGNIARQLIDFMYVKQLNVLQRNLLRAFSIHREAQPLEAALALIDLGPDEEAQVPFFFNALLIQHLLQSSGRGLYHLHAIVVDYVRGQHASTNEQAGTLIDVHYKAAQYYLQQALICCPPLAQRKFVNDVRPLIEATWHLCQSERWQEACDLIYREEIYQLLRRLSENTILLELYQLLQPAKKWHPDLIQEAEIYDRLGRMYALIGQKEFALDNYEHALRIYEGAEGPQEKGRTLHHLGLLYENLEQDEQAQIFHEQALALSRKTGDGKGEADSLNGLGWIYHRRGQKEEALLFCRQALLVHQKNDNRIGESDVLNALGLIYASQGEMKLALDCYERSLSIRRAIGNRHKEGKTLNNLGLVYMEMGQIEKAQELYRRSLAIRHSIGDRIGEGIVLYNLSKTYFNCQDYATALACLLHVRKIFKGVQNKEYEAARRWIEKIKAILGEQAFLALMDQVEPQAVELLKKALKSNATRISR